MHEFYASENGDRWFLAVDARNHPQVVHRPNAASGGRETAVDVEVFLARNDVGSPQHQALTRLIAERAPKL
jgi:hypothetical protein